MGDTFNSNIPSRDRRDAMKSELIDWEAPAWTRAWTEAGRMDGIKTGIEKGREETLRVVRNSLYCQAGSRFGPDAVEQLACQLDPVSNPELLMEAFKQIVEGKSCAELLRCLENRSWPFGALLRQSEMFDSWMEEILPRSDIFAPDAPRQDQRDFRVSALVDSKEFESAKSWIRVGLAEGVEKGRDETLNRIRDSLYRQVGLRFGPEAVEQLACHLDRVSDPELLMEVFKQLVEGKSCAALLQCLESRSWPFGALFRQSAMFDSWMEEVLPMSGTLDSEVLLRKHRDVEDREVMDWPDPRWAKGWIQAGRMEGVGAGIEKGRTATLYRIRNSLYQQAGRRFGPEAVEQLAHHLDWVSDPELLMEVFRQLIEGKSCAALLQCLGSRS